MGIYWPLDVKRDSKLQVKSVIFQNIIHDGRRAVAVIVKPNPDDNTIRQTNGQSGLQDIVINGNEVAVTGKAAILNWQNLTVQQPRELSGHPYVAWFNKNTGAIIAIDGLYTTSNDAGTTIGIDGHGSYYVGGSFSASLTAGPNTVNSTGGGSDFFVAKFGSADCTLATESFEMDKASVYPNPVKGLLHVEGMKGGYVVYDVRGL